MSLHTLNFTGSMHACQYAMQHFIKDDVFYSGKKYNFYIVTADMLTAMFLNDTEVPSWDITLSIDRAAKTLSFSAIPTP